MKAPLPALVIDRRWFQYSIPVSRGPGTRGLTRTFGQLVGDMLTLFSGTPLITAPLMVCFSVRWSVWRIWLELRAAHFAGLITIVLSIDRTPENEKRYKLYKQDPGIPRNKEDSVRLPERGGKRNVQPIPVCCLAL